MHQRLWRLAQKAKVARIVIIMSVIVLAVLSQAQQAPPSFSIEDAKLGQFGTVKFNATTPEPDTAPASSRDFLTAETPNHFRLIIPSDQFTAMNYDRFAFFAYIKNLTNPNSPSYRVTVTALPKGNFGDTREAVTFSINGSRGAIELPLHPSVNPDLLVFKVERDEPVDVQLSGTPRITAAIKNNLPSMGVVIVDSSFEWGCSDCWRNMRLETKHRSGDSILIPKGGGIPVSIVAQPNTLAALLASATTIRSKDPHDTIRMHLTYAPEQGGRERSQTFDVKVRFSPSFWILTGAVLLGSLLGILLKALLVTGQSVIVVLWSRETLVAVLLAFLAEIVAVILMAPEGSSIVLLGVNLDPRQALPCLLLALIISGGPTVKARFNDLVDSLKPRSS